MIPLFRRLLLCLLALLAPAVLSWAAEMPPGEMAPGAMHEHGHTHGTKSAGPQWEGSAEGIAYSEFNHHVAGVLVVMIGLAEMAGALRWSRTRWTLLLLPGAMTMGGLFLLIWSDHEAWPIGRLSLAQTFFGGDHEILQHKIYALLLLGLGLIEWRRRSGGLQHWAWRIPLPSLAVVGGLMLFLHSHGDHPSAHKIALHHAAMGTLSILAGSCKLVSARDTSDGSQSASRWDVAWAGLVLAIGVQLLFYSE